MTFRRLELRRVFALGAMAAAMALLVAASQASALSKHTFSGSFSGSGATALTNPSDVAFDPTSGDLYVANTPEDNRQSIEINALGGSFTLTFKGQTTTPISLRGTFGINTVEVANKMQKALEALSTIGAGNLQVFSPSSLHFIVVFEGERSDAELPQFTADSSGLLGGAATAHISTVNPGASSADIEKLTPSGDLVWIAGKDVNKTKVEEPGSSEAQRNLCTAASGNTCQPGTPGSTPGAFEGFFQGLQNGSGNNNSTYFIHPEHHLFLAVDRSSGDLYVGDPGDGLVTKLTPQGSLDTSWGEGARLDGSSLGPHGLFQLQGRADYHFTIQGLGTQDDGTLLVQRGEIFGNESGTLFRFEPNGSFISAEETRESPETLEASGGAIDPMTHERYFIENHHFDVPLVITHNAPSGKLFEEFGNGELTMPQSVALDPATGEVYVADSGNRRIAVFTPAPYLPDAIPAATGVDPHIERLEGEAKRAGAGPITACHFEYGKTSSYGSGPIACEPQASGGSPFTEPTTHVSAEVPGLEYGTAYHFHLVLENANGENSSYDDTFTTLPLAPTIKSVAGQAFAETALLHAVINPGGGDTTYQAQFVTQEHFENEGFENASSTPELDAGSARTPQEVTAHLNGLAPDTTYHYRLLATNADETVESSPRVFTTLPFVSEPPEECANSHVRQQTSSAQLLDCRAYELVSASHAAGYDVESSVIPGQTPFAGYPQADGRVLYAVHSGGIPGTDHPTNRGLDPYVAVRDKEGWSTEYVGVPADNPFAIGPFSSQPSGADTGLETFAFGAPGGCSPCFEGGYTGVPVRLPNGKLVQGMVAGEGVPTPGPSAKPDGKIAQDLSANGEHFVFGSTTIFAEGGNDETGDVSIYDRNLKTGETHVVSNDPSGHPLQCLQGTGKCDSAEGDANGISELAISKDGSRILIGQKVAEDAKGNPYYHLYMDIGDSPKTIDLTPGTTSGVLFDGMSTDGSKVFFTTKDRLLPSEDTDESADIYMSEVGAGSATLKLVSTNSDGTPANSDSCEPAANTVHKHWNSAIEGEEPNCGVVAVGGGGGVSAANGTIYFLSPQQLQAGKGVEDAPNLYVAEAGGSPRFVTTLESSATAPLPPAEHPFRRSFGSFESPTGVAVSEHPGEKGDTYVLDLTNEEAKGNVRKYNPAGELVSSFGTGGKITGTPPFAGIPAFGLPTTIAVDNDPASASYGDLYVVNIYEEVIEKFSPSGAFEGSFNVPFPTGVAVDSSTGEVFVSSLGLGGVAVFDDEGNELRSFETMPAPSSIAVSPNGAVYVVNGGPYTTQIFEAPEEGEVYSSTGTPERPINATKLLGVAVDPKTEHLYVDEGNKVVEFNASGQRVGLPTGAERLSGSVGLAAYEEEIYVSNRGAGPETGQVAVFGTPVLPSDRETDSPLVIDSVNSPEARHTADFQTNPSGEQAVFSSVMPLAANGEEPNNHTEVFRYDAPSGKLACVSCTLSGFPSTGDSSLASNGLSLTDDGRVFFNSDEPLVSPDTDQKQDVYEWEPSGLGNCRPSSAGFVRGACLALVSAGTSSFDSGLLSATADGKDAYFFTRDSLVPQDENGPTMKVYDAREGGGFPFLLPQAGCRASDECHGAGSPPPPPIENGAESGTPQNHPGEEPEKPKPCKKGLVRKHGHCVPKHKVHKHHTRAHKRGGKK